MAGVEFRNARARAPAVTGTIDQDHPVVLGKPLAERLAHGFQIGTGAMDHHHGRTGGIARSELDDVQAGAGDLDPLAPRRMNTLDRDNAGLRDQRKRRECR